jgi:sugar phosphate isomerase/epimerase
MSFLRRVVVCLSIVVAGNAVASAAKAAARQAALALDQVTVAGCSFPNFTFEGALQKARELGFAGVEIAVFPEKETNYGETYPWVVVDQLTAEEKVRLKALVSQFQHVSTHLPYGPDLRPIAADPAIREKSRRELHRAIDDSGFWGAKLANIHVMSEPGVAFAAAKADLVVLYRELAEHAARVGVRLAIETTRPYGMADYLELVKAIDRENVGGSIDTGHMNFYRVELAVEGAARQTPEGVRRYNDLIAEFVSGLGPKLFHLHIDDVRAVDWREHFLPGEGMLDWRRLFTQLSRANYRGLLVAEILYYSGAADTGPLHKRVFSEKTREGAPAEGLLRMRKFLQQTLASVPADHAR